tara:strand:- start:11 stop:1906 length:1896 start_codon:yes stop_codon:yes gene_type:complete
MDLPDSANIALETVCENLPNGGERRPGQEAMTRMVAESIVSGNHLVVRAGTGTGKSLAYLLPSILSEKPTIVATATKALQDQLAQKDLPFLQLHLEKPFSFSVLKGRSNYVCRQKIIEYQSSDQQQVLEEMRSLVNEEHLDSIIEWAEDTVTGDRSDLSFEPNNATWEKLSVTSNECPGRNKCPSGEICFAETAKDVAAVSDVVVTNLHLYALDICAENAFLPEHEIVVLDEAHKVEEILSSSLGFEIHGGKFRSLFRDAGSVLSSCSELENVGELNEMFDTALNPHSNQRVVPPEDRVLSDLFDLTEARLVALSSVLHELPDITTLDIGARITRVIQSIDSLLENVREARWLEDDSVAWVESTYGRPTMKVALISVDHILNENLWPLRTVVLTSATVPANLANRLGLDEESFSFEDVGSPFDFENQALLYCASHLPDPRNQNYREELHDEIERLIIAAGGRTLALFTSRRALDEATSYLRPRLPFTIFHQDDLPKPALISAFSREEESCLFGTKGLWHGIDIPGPSCSLVIIDRIPFPSPADPLLSARREKIGDSSFREIDLPIAATELSQGVGRLIRSTSDFGVVAVLDSRLAKTDSYRGQLLEALPPMTRTTDLESVTSYLERIETRL